MNYTYICNFSIQVFYLQILFCIFASDHILNAYKICIKIKKVSPTIMPIDIYSDFQSSTCWRIELVGFVKFRVAL